MKKALLVIDVQNDYFPSGRYPLWNSEETLGRIESAIGKAKEGGIPVIYVRHVVKGGGGPFFDEGSEGAELHPRIRAAAPEAPVIVKEFADSFAGTELERVLSGLGVDELLICGMMTHNCVTHTAVSKSAEKYDVRVLADCCTTIDEITHALALHGMSTRLPLVSSDEAI